MADRNRTLFRTTCHATLPGNPDVRVIAFEYGDVFRVEYSGWADDLISAGVMHPSWAERTGKHPRDPDGGHVSVSRNWRTDQGQPRRYCAVQRRRPRNGNYSRWPGATEAIRAYEIYMEANREHKPQILPTGPVPPPRPTLRLVIDNTRGPR